jgi:hypothetical protein
MRERYGDERFTVRRLLTADQFRVGVLAAVPDALGEKYTAQTMGQAFLNHVDRRFGSEGLHLVRAGKDRTGVMRWCVMVG